MAHAHHAAHAYVHYIKVRKEESSQGDLKTKAMLSKASSGNKKLHRPASKRHKSEDQNIDLHKFSSKLESMSAKHSKEKCAKNIRIALQAAGADVSKHPVAASDWGQTLEKNGYKKIKPAFNRPQEGDIYIIERTSGHTYGHIAGYTGNGWFSDFRQKTYAVYKEKDVKYSYYRLDS
ncbi:CHAP domain-containing protein [Acinetobacter baumannii]|uniref:CHAP domain-containing protein n=1 Tax=Acinetobacter baumannii TaxID=470 RepID=UPI00293FD6F8|nr:CHAP domain-containing protein [Acinetobacter baumannii]MDV4225163.1 CHAP domain-containing protein [Acinetobacter baumannii]